MRAILLALDSFFDKKTLQVDREHLLLDAFMVYDNQLTNFYEHGEYITYEEIFNFDDEEYTYN